MQFTELQYSVYNCTVPLRVRHGPRGTLLTPELRSAGIRFLGIPRTRGNTMHCFGTYFPRGALGSQGSLLKGPVLFEI